MNKLEKFLFCHAYPGIDPDSISIIRFKITSYELPKIHKPTAFDKDEPWLRVFVWENYKKIDHATYYHFAEIKFQYYPESRTLYISEGSLRHGRQLVSFELADEFINDKPTQAP